MFSKLIEKTSNFFRGSIHVIGTLVGVKWKGEWSIEGLFVTGWVFTVGIPVGMLLFGTSFPVVGWLIAVLSILIIVNMDDALIMMSNYLTYGVDGDKVAPYERSVK